MTGQERNVAITFLVIGLLYSALMVAVFRYAVARTPAGIIRRLYRSGEPFIVAVNPLNPSVWDPSQPLGRDAFYAPGRATYTLDDPQTVRVRFQPKSGAPIERAAAIPAELLPDTPATRRRRHIARFVIATYLLVGIAAFAVTALLGHGPRTLRIRTGALVALGVVAVTWLATHLLLTARRRSGDSGVTLRAAWRAHHLRAWIVGYGVVVAALGVAWRVSNLDQPHPMSWASSFLSAAVFVLAGGAVVTGSLHHHTYLHHRADPDDTERNRGESR